MMHRMLLSLTVTVMILLGCKHNLLQKSLLWHLSYPLNIRLSCAIRGRIDLGSNITLMTSVSVDTVVLLCPKGFLLNSTRCDRPQTLAADRYRLHRLTLKNTYENGFFSTRMEVDGACGEIGKKLEWNKDGIMQ